MGTSGHCVDRWLDSHSLGSSVIMMLTDNGEVSEHAEYATAGEKEEQQDMAAGASTLAGASAEDFSPTSPSGHSGNMPRSAGAP